MSQKRIAILKVKWEDPCSNNDWAGRKYHQVQTTAQCESVGYGLTRNAKVVQLAQSMSSTGNIIEVISIPRKVVSSIEVIGYSIEPPWTRAGEKR